jgi:riboflavin-specific deaminase-like protein
MAMTADGKIATANRQVSSFGSPRDQEHLYGLRATADAVMCGARTLDSAEVHLGPGAPKYRRLRLRRGLAEYNLRVMVTGSGSIKPTAAIFQRRFSPILVLTTSAAGSRRLARLRKLADAVFLAGRARIDFAKALHWLHTEWGVKRLLCEGGGELNDALFRAGLVDELHLTLCPKIFGGRTAPSISDGLGVLCLEDAARFRLVSSRQRGNELFLCYRAV